MSLMESKRLSCHGLCVHVLMRWRQQTGSVCGEAGERAGIDRSGVKGINARQAGCLSSGLRGCGAALVSHCRNPFSINSV